MQITEAVLLVAAVGVSTVWILALNRFDLCEVLGRAVAIELADGNRETLRLPGRGIWISPLRQRAPTGRVARVRHPFERSPTMSEAPNLHPGETVLKEGRANMQRGLETVGGKVTLTTQRLLFEAHALNLQRGATEVWLQQVVGQKGGWTKFLGAIPMVPNSIVLTLADGQELSFVVTGRAAWLAAIEQARGGDGVFASR